MIKKFAVLATAILAGCTYNQEMHLREFATIKQNGFNRVRDLWIVEQSMENPTTEFSLDLKPFGNETSFLLNGSRIPYQEWLIFASIDPTNHKIDPLFEFQIREDGQIQILDKNGIRFENEIPFIACEGLAVGKPIVYAVVSKEKFTIASAEFNPFPIEAKSDQGVKVALVVSHPMMTRFKFEASGFSPQESVKLIHESGGRTEEIEATADDQGSLSLELSPLVFGKLGGEASLIVASEKEELELDYPWGTQLEKKTFEERSQFPFLFVVNRSQDEIFSHPQFAKNSASLDTDQEKTSIN